METGSVIIFLVQDKEFSLALDQVQTIEKVEPLSRDESWPNYVHGIAEIRGERYPVIDLAEIFYGESQSIGENSRYILLNTEPIPVALLVTQVKEIRTVTGSQLKKVDLIRNKDNRFISGVIHFEDHLMPFLDTDQLLGTIDPDQQLAQIRDELLQESN